MSNIIQGASRAIYDLAFRLSPIILTGGVADSIPGGLLPLIVVTEGLGLLTGLLSGGGLTSDLDSFFAHYAPLPGTSLVENEFGHFPFANQAVAANAIIRQPLRVSLLMHCPVRKPGGHISRIVTFTAIKKLLDRHHAKGGTYTVATPSYIFQNCLLAALRDVGNEAKQPQSIWQWDFEQPLLTAAQAEQAQNDQMSKLGTLGTKGATAAASAVGGATGGGNAAAPAAAAAAPATATAAAEPGLAGATGNTGSGAAASGVVPAAATAGGAVGSFDPNGGPGAI